MFFNGEKEIDELLRIVRGDPNIVTFVYGPINSGKTALMREFISRLPDNYVAFYVNLRATPVTDYEDFLDVLFSIDVESPVQSLKEALSLVLSAGKEILGIPIPESVLTCVLRGKKPKNAFAYIIKLLGEVKDKGKAPILILNELQVIRDLNVNGPVIYELFNFFVHITKEAHLAHVFVVTSDSLFIEEVYNEAMLQGRSDYLLVDDFDESTTLEFLTSHGLEKRKAKLALEYFGGKPSN
ncbi:ATP-binding protein [Pyrococcus kukulkanii]|uniref:ATP-binding protein n=1 Tax=Pyrococcus kukulkanii TaxID=1609559 RepID=UPI0035686118